MLACVPIASTLRIGVAIFSYRDQVTFGVTGDGESAADVEVLARHVLGWDRARLLAHRRDPVPERFAVPFEALVDRRVDRVPVAYLTGTREFFGLDFEVTPDVLIPRPETELAVEAVLDALAASGSGRVVDVGTGSGCIAIAVAVTRPAAAVVALDRSRSALAVARRNARRHDVLGRVAFVAADLVTALADGVADVIVSNPPYVPNAGADVAVDVARHEPATALYAGPDGLDVIRRLLTESARVLRPGGALIMEIGAGQAGEVRAAAAAHGGGSAAALHAALQGIPRVAVLRQPGTASALASRDEPGSISENPRRGSG
jgi:release factor glutamine methyltransferase